jgi:hypothetical protein
LNRLQALLSTSTNLQQHQGTFLCPCAIHHVRQCLLLLTVILLGLIPHFSAQSQSRALPPIPPSDSDRDELKNEDNALSAQQTELAESTRQLFVCGICLEEMPDDSIVRPDPCGHTFCRDCLRGHVTTRLNERRFPILCPTCTASKGKGKGVAGGTCCDRIINTPIISHMTFFKRSRSPLPWALGSPTGNTVSGLRWKFLLSLFSCTVGSTSIVLTRYSANVGIGASDRCSWPEMTSKTLISSRVRFRTAIIHGANTVNSRSTQAVRSTRAMAFWN